VLVLNDTISAAPYTTPRGDGFADLVVTEAFRRAGLQLRLEKLPAARALRLADAGLEDGELARAAGIEKFYPNLVRVPEKLGVWVLAAFSKNAAIPGEFPAMRSHVVGLIRGWKGFEDEMTGAPRVVAAEDAEQLFRLLALDRIEVALFARDVGSAMIQRKALHGIHLLQPTLGQRDVYIYLHKRHAADAPRIADALRALKAEGYYQRLYNEKILPYLGDSAP